MLWHIAAVVCWFSQCSVVVGTESHTSYETCVEHVEEFASPVVDKFKDKLKSASYVNIRCLKKREGEARPSAKRVLKLIGPQPRMKV